jgi:hypothetical protein
VKSRAERWNEDRVALSFGDDISVAVVDCPIRHDANVD